MAQTKAKHNSLPSFLYPPCFYTPWLFQPCPSLVAWSFLCDHTVSAFTLVMKILEWSENQKQRSGHGGRHLQTGDPCRWRKKGHRWKMVGRSEGGQKKNQDKWVAATYRNYSKVSSHESVVLATWGWKLEGWCSLQLWTVCCQGNWIHPWYIGTGHEDLCVRKGIREPEFKASYANHYTPSHSQCPYPYPWNHTWDDHFLGPILNVGTPDSNRSKILGCHV